MEKKKIIVIGAGIAGISAAIRLQSKGYEVSVFEANSYPGGKLTEFKENGYRFDMGPSLFTMPQFVEELFKVANKDISNYFSYKKKDIICKYFYEDGTVFNAFSDLELFSSEASKVFNVENEIIKKYINNSKKKYDLTAPLFLEKSLHKVSTYLSKDTIKAILKIFKLDINKNLNQLNTSVFSDKRLIQFFNRFATYNGSSPYETPGIMSMIPHLEQNLGTFFPKGGMHQITLSLFKLSKDLGVTYYFNSNVQEIIVENKKTIGVKEKGILYKSDIVISNADIVPTYRKLLPKHKSPSKVLNQPRSSSALIFYWGIKTEFKHLDLHNIFFSEDYKTEFDYIFKKHTVFNDPTIYINITSIDEPKDAPNGCQNWFVMINVPSNIGQDWDRIINTSRINIKKKLNRLLNTNLDDFIVFEKVLDPRLIEAKTQSYQGALYGASSNNKFAAFLRHPNFKHSIKNLYFCGGSVHPGGGIPLCLLSGKIVSELIESKI